MNKYIINYIILILCIPIVFAEDLSGLKTGLIAWYTLDSNSNSSTNQYNLTTTGNPAILTGKKGNAFNYTGIGNYSQSAINSPITGSSNRTMALWYKPDTNSSALTNGKLLGGETDNGAGKNDMIAVYGANINPRCFIWTNGGDSACPNNVLRVSQWIFIAYTYNGTAIQIYINGTSVTNTTSAMSTTAHKIEIGREVQRAYGGTPNGLIDEVAIWNRTLTDAEIKSLWNSGNGLTYTDLVNNVPTIDSNITISILSPINYTYTFNSTPTFFGNVSYNSGSNWTIALYVNGTMNKNITFNTTGIFNITSTSLTLGQEYLWWFNATVMNGLNGTNITEKRNLFVIGNATSTPSTSCVTNLGNAYFRPNSCTTFP